MGSSVNAYCDGCGALLVNGNLAEAVSITALGTNGLPTQMFLCIKPEVIPPPKEADDDIDDTVVEMVMPKITGCARKVLSAAVLSKLYEEVQAYTGDEKAKPFQL